MAGLTREDILRSVGHAVEPVEVPEWGGTVYLRTLTAGELLALNATAHEDASTPSPPMIARLLVACLCDESGKRLLTDADAAALESKPAPILYRLYRVAGRLNGLDAVEGLEKN